MRRGIGESFALEVLLLLLHLLDVRGNRERGGLLWPASLIGLCSELCGGIEEPQLLRRRRGRLDSVSDRNRIVWMGLGPGGDREQRESCVCRALYRHVAVLCSNNAFVL